jgi:23S rRNA pseudouridine2605 synthase
MKNRWPNRKAARLWRYHKPSGLVTTHKDEKGRPTVFANLPKALGRWCRWGGWISIPKACSCSPMTATSPAVWKFRRRLDPHLPRRLFGKVTQADLDKLATGITIDGVNMAPSSPIWSAARACIAGPRSA